MKKLLVALIVLLTVKAISQEFRVIDNNAFSTGEQLEYKVYYHSRLTGKVKAGEAQLHIKPEVKSLQDRPVYHIVGKGRSTGLFNLFFKVRDRFETFIDTSAMVPWMFIRRTNEGSYTKNNEVRFYHRKQIAESRYETNPIPNDIQDIISAFYYARTIDYSNAQPGDVYPVDFYIDDTTYISRIVFKGREVIKTDLGYFKCLRFQPEVATGNVFSQEYPMDLWVSDDENHIPVMAKSEVIVGSVKMELIGYANLLNPLSALMY
ncbi:MAG: DUF3108 domain-containing protein [Bacteroidales bacterium]|nr:DUF3108 domain-containing protein [Bacteroidales bacterium]